MSIPREEPSLQRESQSEVTLTVPVKEAFLPLTTAFVEKAALGFGMDEADALSLTLAAEEIFAYLTHASSAGRVVEIRCRGGGHFVEEVFLFPAAGFNMKAFNITAPAVFDDAADTKEAGLLIASRIVDRFHFHEADGNLRLTMVKEKTYPEITEEPVAEPTSLKEYSVRTPDPEELKLLVHLVNQYMAPHLFPPHFRFPGKVADMVASGENHALIAADGAGSIGGGIVWGWRSERLLECFGPYLFNQERITDMSEALLDACLGKLAKTGAVGLISRRLPPDLLDEYFERLGYLALHLPDGSTKDVPVAYRHLEEDPGTSVWTHPALEEFLAGEYRRLAFAREIRRTRNEGETHSPFSVLSAEFDRINGRVILRPVWWGDDLEETVAGYVETLLREGIPSIFFEMDLGKGWHTRFTPALLKNGFTPRLLLPYCGKADLVVFQHSEGPAA
jgi:anti-sigma regulatory factor (Ser/Thr protein kinase)